MKYTHLFESLQPGETFIFPDVGCAHPLRAAQCICSSYSKYGRRFKATATPKGIEVMRIDGTNIAQGRPKGKYRTFLETLEINKPVEAPENLGRVEICHFGRKMNIRVSTALVGDKVMVWRIA